MYENKHFDTNIMFLMGLELLLSEKDFCFGSHFEKKTRWLTHLGDFYGHQVIQNVHKHRFGHQDCIHTGNIS